MMKVHPLDTISMSSKAYKNGLRLLSLIVLTVLSPALIVEVIQHFYN
jgi:hypothetical protein